VFLLWFVVALGAVGTGREVLYNLWYLLTALLIVSFVWAWIGVRRVSIQRQTRTTRSQVGKMAEERLIVANDSWLPKLWLEVRDYSTLPEHQVSHVISPLGAHKTHVKSIRTRCGQRGRFTLGPLMLSSGDPFGLFRTSRRLAEPHETSFIVLPATIDLPAFAPLVGFLPGGDMVHRRTSYVTTNVSGVREYAPGDSLNRIHWPSTARTGRLISKEFELDPTADIWLLVDLDRAAQAELPLLDTAWQKPRLPWEAGPTVLLRPSTVEYGVTITASLAKHFIARDRSVGFMAYCPQREIIPADRGERQLAKILETLAVIRADGLIPLAEVITAEGTSLKRNTTVIIVTASSERVWIAPARDINHRGVRVISILIDPQSFGHTRSNQELVDELTISGISTYLVREGDDLAQALTRPYAQGIMPVGRSS